MSAGKRSLVLMSAVVVSAALGCGGTDRATEAMPHVVSSDVERAVPVEIPAVEEAVGGMRAFAHRLLSEHPELVREGNGVVSAASLATAFAMVRAGAEGETADQIDAVFGFPPRDLGPAFNFLTDRWEPAGGAGGPELSVANSLFVQDGFALRQAFLDALARDFGAGVRTVDFSGDAAEVINAWVREQTRDRIRKLFDELPGDTMLVIADAIHLKVTWARRFHPANTRDGDFHRAASPPARVPFLHQTARFDHVDGEGWSVVRLPYAGGELSMWVLLPAGGGDPVTLLDPAVLARAATSARPEEIDLALPKWTVDSDLPLARVLAAMGMPRAFSDRAEFPGIAIEPPLKVGQVRHRATLTVDEEGTEAAAATGIAMQPHRREVAAAGAVRRRPSVRVRRDPRRDRDAAVRGRGGRPLGDAVAAYAGADDATGEQRRRAGGAGRDPGGGGGGRRDAGVRASPPVRASRAGARGQRRRLGGESRDRVRDGAGRCRG